MRTILKIAKDKQLRNKVLFTLLCITLFRVGSSIPLPIVDTNQVASIFGENSFLGLYELFSGGSLSNFSLFALGITPYITASIVIHLLTISFKHLEELTEQGDRGQQRIKLYTKILGLFLAFCQALAILLGAFKGILINDSKWFMLMSAGILTFGVYLLIVMDSKIEKSGIGKGSAIIICSSILSNLPESISQVLKADTKTEIKVGLLIGSLVLILAVVAVQQATRRVQIRYSKHSVSNANKSITSESYLPLKINQASITPVIFASTMLTLPSLIVLFIDNDFTNKLQSFASDTNSVMFNVVLASLIVFFNYFYTSVAFDIEKIAENLKNSNSFIPGVRPGNDTAKFLSKITYRLVFVGSIFLILITLVPTVISAKVQVTITLLGTSLLIVTSTCIDLIKQVQAELTKLNTRNYFNF